MAIEAEALLAPDAHPFEDVQFWETKRQITHAEARESATRLINSHFRNEDRARVSIPANPDRDDDLIIQSYIRQQARAARDGSLIHRSALAEDTARAEEGTVLATGWLTHMGREDDEERGPVVRFVLDASREHALKFVHIWNGATYEIRALPLDKEAADANR